MHQTSFRFFHHTSLVWMLVLAGADFVGAQNRVSPTPENEKCVVLDEDGYKALETNHFLKTKTPTFDDYKAYRSTIEVVEYSALSSAANPVFTMPRNVTEQDEVVLRLRGNTYAYSYVASYTASDLVQRELLNVIGASSTKGIFEAQADAAALTKSGAAIEAARPAAKAGTDQSGGVADEAFARLGATSSQYQAALQKLQELRSAVSDAITVTLGDDDGTTLEEALVAFEAAVESLQLAYARARAQVISDPTSRNFNDLETALSAAETAAGRLPTVMASLRSQINRVTLEIDRELPPARAVLQRMLDAVPVARTQLTGDDRAAFDEQVDALQLQVLLGDAAELEFSRERLGDQAAALTASATRALATLSSARLDIARFQAAGRQTEICRSLGRFRNKTVKVTVTATPLSPPAQARDPAEATQAASGVITSEDSFEADAPTHVHVKLGLTFSTLDNPEFALRSVTDGCPEGRQCFIPYITDSNRMQLLPAAHLSLFVPGRYFGAGADHGDPYEATNRRQWLVPYPTFGFALTDTTSNVMIGMGVDFTLGIGFQAGVHFGEVTRLLPEVRAENDESGLQGRQFDRPAGTTVAIADVTDEKQWTPGFYVSLSIDASTLGRLLNLGQGNGR